MVISLKNLPYMASFAFVYLAKGGVHVLPSYLFDMLSFHVPARSLRSSADGPRLEIPYCKTVLASRAFSIYAPRLWNGLPLPLRNSISPSNPPSTSLPLSTFKSMLKTHFSTLAFEAGTV